MLNLLKADLLRVFKDKLFMVLCIIGAAMSIVTPLLLGGIVYLAAKGSTVDTREVLSGTYFSILAFSPFNNFGIVTAIFMCIILCKDFTNGTIRNKIITGKSRFEIYLSNALTTMIYMVCICFTYSLLNFGFAIIFFNSGLNTGELVGRYFASLGLELIGWITLSLAVAFYATTMKNAGLAIVIYVAIGMVLTIAGTILVQGISYFEYANPDNVALINTLKVLQNINIPYAMGYSIGVENEFSSILGVFTKYSLDFVLEYLSSCIVFIASFFGFGYLIFSHKDLK